MRNSRLTALVRVLLADKKSSNLDLFIEAFPDAPIASHVRAQRPARQDRQKEEDDEGEHQKMKQIVQRRENPFVNVLLIFYVKIIVTFKELILREMIIYKVILTNIMIYVRGIMAVRGWLPMATHKRNKSSIHSINPKNCRPCSSVRRKARSNVASYIDFAFCSIMRFEMVFPPPTAFVYHGTSIKSITYFSYKGVSLAKSPQ